MAAAGRLAVEQEPRDAAAVPLDLDRPRLGNYQLPPTWAVIMAGLAVLLPPTAAQPMVRAASAIPARARSNQRGRPRAAGSHFWLRCGWATSRLVAATGARGGTAAETFGSAPNRGTVAFITFSLRQGKLG